MYLSNGCSAVNGCRQNESLIKTALLWIMTHGKISLILYIVWGVVLISSQVFGHLGSFKGRIQTNTSTCGINAESGHLYYCTVQRLSPNDEHEATFTSFLRMVLSCMNTSRRARFALPALNLHRNEKHAQVPRALPASPTQPLVLF